MNLNKPVQSANALRGLIRAIYDGGAYDGLHLALGTEQWARLAGYLNPFPVTAGQVPIQQGDTDRTLYMMESGALTVHLSDDTGRLRLAVLAPGTVVGEGAFFSGQPRSANVVATRESMLWRMTQPSFEQLSRREPEIALALAMACAAVVVRRLAHTTLRIAVI